ncbi:MAG: hypothetical protein KGD60_14500 [Candidatus Thorarchaeota archaeon]|nr:hypothetical protein [Candidatus Thorarchaeota archaeon]
MTTDTQVDTNFYWTVSLQNLPILLFFGEVCKTFGFPESYDTRDSIPGMRHEVWENRGLYFTYLDNRRQKENADVIIVCTKEETRDGILRVLSRMAKKRERRRRK